MLIASLDKMTRNLCPKNLVIMRNQCLSYKFVENRQKPERLRNCNNLDRFQNLGNSSLNFQVLGEKVLEFSRNARKIPSISRDSFGIF